MSGSSTAATFEECADEMNDFVATLGRYPDTVLAFALRAHLAGILQALMAHGGWSSAQAAAFLEDMRRETLETEDD